MAPSTSALPRSIEAAAVAEGYCYARYPALTEATGRAAVDYALMTLQLLRAAPTTIDRNGGNTGNSMTSR